MSPTVTYLLQANLALGLFYLAYRLMLRRLTFYGLNRVFLAFGIVFSAAYPAIDLSGLPQHYPRTDLSRLVAPAAPDQLAASGTPPVNYGALLGVIYWLGVAVVAGRMVFQLLSLYRVHRRSESARCGPYAFRRLADRVAPFSFWQTVYLNPGCHDANDLPVILQHENVHVREWHTLDLLLAELTLLICWFNPAAWLLKGSVGENLEFRTDRQLLRGGIDCKAYQYSLLHLSHSTPPPALANYFNFITLKTRIAMMNKPLTSRQHLAKYALLLPLIVAIAFTTTLAFGQGSPAAASGAKSPRTVKIGNSERVVYYLDGKPADKALIDKLNPADIEKIEVFKEERAAAILGDTTNGLVVVTTKKNKDSAAVRELNEKINKAKG
jgi:hypothetical protein